MLESDSGKSKRLPLLFWLTALLLLVGMISQVTTNALGTQMEATISAGYARLESINDLYTDKISAISPGTDSLHQALREIVARYFRSEIGKAHDWEVFNWLELKQVPVSDFRHDKIMRLIHQGRQEYREVVIGIRRARDSYRQALDSVYSGVWLKLNGFPTIDVDADPIGNGSG